MAYIRFENNPCGKNVGDCVIRALSKAMDTDWESIYINLASEGLEQCDLPNSNSVWSKFLLDSGYRRYAIPNKCPACYSVEDFCYDYPVGTYILATGSHVVAVIDGDYYDAWDSGRECPVFYFQKEVY